MRAASRLSLLARHGRDLTLSVGLAAAIAAILFAAPAIGAPPTSCGGNPVPYSLQLYHFSVLSTHGGSGVNGHAFNCVQDNDRSRAVRIKWPAVQLEGFATVGGPVYGGMVGRTPRAFRTALFYGTTLAALSIDPTWTRAEDLVPGLIEPASAGLFRRAAFWQAQPSAASENPRDAQDQTQAASSEALVYIPADPAMLAGFARHRVTLSGLVAWFEAHPDRLQPFSFTSVASTTALSPRYSVTSYQLAFQTRAMPAGPTPLLYLRISDPALQNALFHGAAPVPLTGGRGDPVVMRGSVPDRLVRTAQLEILLGDRRTIIASVPIASTGQSAP